VTQRTGRRAHGSRWVGRLHGARKLTIEGRRTTGAARSPTSTGSNVTTSDAVCLSEGFTSRSAQTRSCWGTGCQSICCCAVVW